MIFIRYENWRSYLRYYPITCLILAANVVMFVILLLNGGPQDPNTQLKYGAITNFLHYGSEGWRLFASMFLHFDFNHLLSNCFAILIFAPPLERLMGHWKYLVLYLGSGVIGNMITLYLYLRTEQVHMSVGASGAVYGVYGALLYIALLQRHRMDVSSRKTLYALLIIGIFYSLLVEQVNWVAHFGGLLGGFLLYGLMTRLFKQR